MIKERIIIVDVLRGFALLMIVLIHYVEHFDFFKSPQVNFLFSSAVDKEVMRYSYILISGKAYSIFALLFGLSFFIQMDNKAQKGIDYRWRFLWRMIVLLIIGFFHSLIYRGDILHIYALLSFPIILLFKVKTKYLWIIAFLLIIQIPMIYNLIQTFTDSNYEYTIPLKGYFGEGNSVYATGDFWEVVRYNFWKGRITVWAWTFNNGRYLQLIALFVVGLIIGRERVFENIDSKFKWFLIVLLISVALVVLLIKLNSSFKTSDLTELQKGFLNTIITSIINLSATTGVISLVTLLYIRLKNLYIFKLFSAYGKMSLTNYVLQAIFGVILFYDFGFGLYKFLGSTWSIILGLMIFLIQALISKYWNGKYRYGPLEWFWRCSTNLDFSIKIKR
ncbi:MAG: DUF418 domain-containing protein [Thiohalospira sp.]